MNIDPLANAAVPLTPRAQELMRRRQISGETAQTFKDILAKAGTADAQADPKVFLAALSRQEMETLRRVQCLADPIDIAALSPEGAANLLTQPGSAVDMNNDGLLTVGAGHGFAFPPANAPESFKAAWATATAGMTELDVPTHMIFAVGLANIGREPGDPNWINPYADPDYDYRGCVERIVSGLKYEYELGMISAEQYRRDMSFYSRLAEAMG